MKSTIHDLLAKAPIQQSTNICVTVRHENSVTVSVLTYVSPRNPPLRQKSEQKLAQDVSLQPRGVCVTQGEKCLSPPLTIHSQFLATHLLILQPRDSLLELDLEECLSNVIQR